MKNKFILGAVLLLAQKNYAAINKNTTFEQKIKKNVTVAVIDTGADINHKDLQNVIWINEGEIGKDLWGRNKSNNGIDDDHNGFVDDIHGWNFVDNNNNVSDSHGHGTHISGIIKKEFQRRQTDRTPIPSVQLMILKYYSPEATDSENVLNTAKAIEYATKMNAQIINYSGGGSSQYLKEFKAIETASKKNILFIAAAGNNNMNTDDIKYYPANYPLENIISVAATDNKGELVSFSNYGSHTVDIAAPGKLIYSSMPNNTYGIMSGTSQATAFISGVAASLIVQKNMTRSKEILIDLLAGSKFKKSLKGKTKFQLALVNPS